MTEPVVVGPSTTVQDAAAAILDGGVQAAIVVDGDEICGLVTAEGVARALAQGCDVARTPAVAVADRDVPVVGEHEPLPEVHQRMRAAAQPLAVVVGEDRRAVGLLADHEAAP